MKNLWNLIKEPFFVLAPMDGVTDFVFRELVSEIAKPDVLMTEFTNVDSLFSRGRENSLRRLKFSKKQKPVIAQLWGSNPTNYLKASELITELGFDGIDLNMGCPTKAVMKKDSGAALIDKPELAAEIINATKIGTSGKVPVSVKTRLGISTDQSSEWIPFLLKQEIAALTVHFRTAEEQSKVAANWKKAYEIVTYRDELAPTTKIIGNGDVNSLNEGLELSKKYNVDGIMIGRGVFSNPWFFQKTQKKHTTEDYFKILRRHLELHKVTFGEDRFWELKKFVKMYIKDFKGSNQLRTKIMRTNNFADFETMISAL